ncbi:hypothetical protein ACIRVF_41420 [Kitasatospora sp. NPDC101157]|uniref:hypothetical protein n=1 Tax=Kitasatospora sp. NPDC101157 TaxID=3364098 RepID=UPI00380483A9
MWPRRRRAAGTARLHRPCCLAPAGRPHPRHPDPEPAASDGAGKAADRQVLIGDFSPDDCEDYLARRLTADGRPLIGDNLRQVITARSHGLPLFLDLAVMRFLEIRRPRTPEAADFDHDFPALVARTLQDLTPDERHVLRAVSLLDAFDIALATATASMTHQAAALRLAERPFVREDQLALWPYHLHAVVRSTIRRADDHTDDRWPNQDWASTAARTFDALGDQWTSSPDGSRRLLAACLRQGLALARDHRLGLGWLSEAAWTYVSDSVWEPLVLRSTGTGADRDGRQPLATAADAPVETLNALARRQHEHRARTVQRLAAVVDTSLLPEDPHHLAVYYLAKAQRDLGHRAGSRAGMQLVADGGGRLAPAALRGLVHLARLAGDFPAAHQAAQGLGRKGRQHRVEGDILWPHGDMRRASEAYLAARTDAEQHDVAGERATSQAQRAFTLAFTDPQPADDEIDLAEQLLAGLDLRATTLTVRTAALIRGAGRDGVDERLEVLRTEARTAGIVAAQARLRDLVRGGDYAYYTDITHHMAGQRPDAPSGVHWPHNEETVRTTWRDLVTARQTYLNSRNEEARPLGDGPATQSARRIRET